jgi:transcriptional regulator with XRE-family HTH domain
MQTQVATGTTKPVKKSSDKVRARRADHRDAEVGRRVRTRRMQKGLSQSELGDRIGVTFQQVQKYEKGVNRIGSGRLERIATALEVPIAYFFGDGKGGVSGAKGGGEQPQSVLLQTRTSVRLLEAFNRFVSPRAARLFVELAEEIAGVEK